jgi:tRNA dimethylallyltransferase
MIWINSLEDQNKHIPIICGPTASGKTDIAVKLIESYPLEIISADSRQIIKHLNVGTAKPSEDEQVKYKFHLIDIVEPGQRYSAFQFIDNAESLIGNILKAKKIPIIVGGTGFYLRALTDGVVEIEQDDFTIREKLEKQYEEQGEEKLFKQLEKIDPLEATKIHPHNRIRLIRALEIYYLTGKSKSELMTTGAYKKSKYNFYYYCINPERDNLYNKINRRVDKMLETGLITEIQQLIAQGMRDNIKKANVIGYNEILSYLDGNYSLEEAVSMIKQNSRRYAKRQMTWFRKQENLSFYRDFDNLLADLRVELDKYL